MIEVHLEKRDSAWDLTATLLPQGGLAIAKEARLATISSPSFGAAAAAITSLDSVSFVENRDRWPVDAPKFQIVNEMSHVDHEKFGNYRVQRGEKVLGHIKNFPRSRMVDLIREALQLVANVEGDTR